MRLSHFQYSSLLTSLLRPCHHYIWTMSALSFVVELDGFQHSEEHFVLKCLAVSCGRLRTTYFRLFDTSFLVSRGPAALRTYQYQTRHHGLAVASAGLPQAMARSVLMHAVLEAFIDLSERGDLAPAQVIMWVKGTQKTALVTQLMSTPALPWTSGSWSAPYTGKSPTVQHLAVDSRTGLRSSGTSNQLRPHEDCRGKTASRRLK